MPQDKVKSVIEALLFVSENPLTIEEIRNVLPDLKAVEIRGILEEMAQGYHSQERGVRLIEVAGGFRMVTAPELGEFLKKLLNKGKRVERLSKPALQTLAIIAYKQPLTKLEIELLRNVNVDGVMKSLLDKELIRISGRKDVSGRPYVFGTTKQFLEYFGLGSLRDLPKIEEFSELAGQKADVPEEQSLQRTEVLDGAE